MSVNPLRVLKRNFKKCKVLPAPLNGHPWRFACDLQQMVVIEKLDLSWCCDADLKK